MTSNAVLLDGYVDEPACLGVPPYLSPDVRAAAGVLSLHGYQVRYLTIDQLRADPAMARVLTSADLLVMIAGVTVPGKYLGGTPATLTEIQQIGAMTGAAEKVIAGPIGFGFSGQGGERAVKATVRGFDALLPGSPSAALDAHLQGLTPDGTMRYLDYDRWAAAGADIVPQHPSFPYLVCELETARGCARQVTGGCSFCTEPLYGPPRYRSVEGVKAEVGALARAGARHFRLGRQPDLLAYQSGSGEFPEPDPAAIEALFSAIREAAPDLATLHIDNVNPGTIARHPEASAAALSAIIKYHTPGDVAAFGMETADPAVVQANNLKAEPEEVLEAIRVVNALGAVRDRGIPELLPGLNFVFGLAGETAATFDLDRRFLQQVLDEGLLVRRINLRQLMPFEGTRAYTKNTLGLHQSLFKTFKEEVRTTIDLPMLEQVFPVGTILADLIIEQSGSPSFGRQMGTYPILAGVPLSLPVGTVLDVVVVGHGMRSLTALPCPVPVNTLPASALVSIPGIGKKRARAIAGMRPFSDLAALSAVAGPTPIDHLFTF
jgi:radical SAM superfamily enzyme with C-terminal helix-hairpin-helix motif